MNNVTNIALRLSALSVLRGILNRSVPKAFYRFLLSLEKSPEEFLRAYGEFFSLVSERGCASNLAYALTEAILFDDNCFARAAVSGKHRELPSEVLFAVAKDCETVLAASQLEKKDILSAYRYYDEIKDIAPSLPEWHSGECVPALSGFDGSTDRLADYYKANGCGMFARYNAFIWRDGSILPVENHDKIKISNFTGYERQRKKIVENTLAFIDGKSCNNCLLYGDMGTGKSSTVKAIANEFRGKGLRIVEMPKERLIDFPRLVDEIAGLPMKFIIFIDDLSFQSQDQSYTTLKAVLEGGVASRPKNALIYATSNRRHIVKECLSDRAMSVDDIHTRDNMQETLSLSDRFGLRICYSVPGKQEFLEIVFALAQEYGVELDSDELAAGAERFALAAGGRSPRCAKQYIESLNS